MSYKKYNSNNKGKKPIKSVKKPVKKGVKRPPPKKRDEGCFITTACVNYYGLSDNAYELVTLRKFRDSQLLLSKSGSILVEKYYNVAPKIVQCLNTDPKRNRIYSLIFAHIKLACSEIEKKDYNKAKNIYIRTVSLLVKKYNIN